MFDQLQPGWRCLHRYCTFYVIEDKKDQNARSNIYYLIANRDSTFTFTFTTPLQNFYNRMQFKIIWLHVHLKNILFMNKFILLLNAYLNVECDKS